MNKPDWTIHPHVAIAKQDFPRLARCLADAERLLKTLRGYRNKGKASDQDVEDARTARDALRNVLVTGNWIDAEKK